MHCAVAISRRSACTFHRTTALAFSRSRGHVAIDPLSFRSFHATASLQRCFRSFHTVTSLQRFHQPPLAAAVAPETSSSTAGSGATLLDGIATSQIILDNIASHIKRERESGTRAPFLAVLLCNNSRESERYVQRKADTAKQVGIESETYRFDNDTVTKDEIIEKIKQLNDDPKVDGILVQLPLPEQCAKFEATILAAVAPAKDVDGFHPSNMGNLAALAAHQGGAHARAARTEMTEAETLSEARAKVVRHVPCTPKACMELIDRYNIDLQGKHVVIFGRSATVGLPLTLMMFSRPAAVTNIDENLDRETAQKLCAMADVVLVGVGQPEYVRADWLKPGAVVIDVGINFVPKTAELTGRAAALENPIDAQASVRLCGDVAFEECAAKASYITPVPGGVGPMTVAMCMESVLRSYLYHVNK
jgi:5,10-methylene-tetrahydrofolate dehydrogenase/methenyl tetrahydrofolate cyclohydrolase